MSVFGKELVIFPLLNTSKKCELIIVSSVEFFQENASDCLTSLRWNTTIKTEESIETEDSQTLKFLNTKEPNTVW